MAGITASSCSEPNRECIGERYGTALGPRQLFKPHAFRQRMFDAAIADAPDEAIAIGDHIYWDLRRGAAPRLARALRKAPGSLKSPVNRSEAGT